MTLATPRVRPVGWAKVFIWGKVVTPARVTLPVGVRHSSTREVSPPEKTRGHSYKRLFKFEKDAKKKENSTRVTRVEGCFGFPRPYQCSLSYVHGHSTVPSKHTNTRDKTWNSGGGGQIEVDEYIVQKCRFRLHYERVLYRKQLQLDYERKRARVF